MTFSQLALIVLVAAAVVFGLGAIAVQVVPISGPGADVAIGRAVAGSYAIWSSIALSALALVLAVRVRKSVGTGYLVLGLAPGAVWVVAWMWLSIAYQLDPRSSPDRHCLFVEVGQPRDAKAVQLIGLRLYEDDGYSGRGFSDDEGWLSQSDVVRDDYLIGGSDKRALEVELADRRVYLFSVPIPLVPRPMPWTTWQEPSAAMQRLPTGRAKPLGEVSYPVIARFRVTPKLDMSCREDD